MNLSRVVITGVGLTAPNGNNLQEFRNALLEQKSGITEKEVRFMGKIPVGECNFDEEKHQKKKMRRRGTRVGSISVYCAKEAFWFFVRMRLACLSSFPFQYYFSETLPTSCLMASTRQIREDSATSNNSSSTR